MSKKQAIMTQFSTAIPAFLGTYVALFGMEHMKTLFGVDLMVPFTAGGFIYLSSVTLITPLLEEKQTPTVRLMQIISIITGILFMYYVGVMEHEGGHHALGHVHDHPVHVHENIGHNHSHGHHHEVF